MEINLKQQNMICCFEFILNDFKIGLEKKLKT